LDQPGGTSTNTPKPPIPGVTPPIPESTPPQLQVEVTPVTEAPVPLLPGPATPPPKAVNSVPPIRNSTGNSIEEQLRSVARAQRAAQARALAQQAASVRRQMALARDSFWSTPLEPSVAEASDSPPPSTVASALPLTPTAQSEPNPAGGNTPGPVEPAQISPSPSPSALTPSAVLPQAMAAIRSQWDSFDDFFTLNWDPPGPVAMPNVRVPTADCPPMQDAELDQIIQSAAGHNDMPPGLIKAVMGQESAFHPCSVSTAGAMGLMQLMPATAQAFAVTDPFAPAQNVEAGAKYLKQLIERYHGDVRLALGAYNAGAGRVDQAGGIPDIPETIDYIRRIMDALPNQSDQ
jgi:soluble lytic murein transglycosylase-like protein